LGKLGLFLIMKNKDELSKDKKISNIITILKFLLTIDDEEVLKSSLESIIEQLEDIK
jgi:hypothetical protein